MIYKKCLLSINNYSQFYSKINDCLKKKNYIKKIRLNCKQYVKSKSYILDKTTTKIEKYLP